MTDREEFIAVLSNGPILRANAIVCLCGEDGDARVQVVGELWRTGETPPAEFVVLSGGLEDPPRLIGATSARPRVLGMEVAPSKLIVDDRSTDTREQAEFIAGLCQDRKWRRILLVASAYHQYRAFLTVLQSLADRDLEQETHVLSVAANQVRWWDRIPGTTVTRAARLEEEFAKIERYRALGHVADYRHALDYLAWWEKVVG